jgi:hypothetical protein
VGIVRARALAEDSAGVVGIEFGSGLAYHLGGMGDFGEVRYAEEAKALSAAHASVSSGGVQPPAVATSRTCGDDVHLITFVPGVTELLSVSVYPYSRHIGANILSLISIFAVAVSARCLIIPRPSGQQR